MHGRFGPEDVLEQLTGDLGIQHGTRLQRGVQDAVALKDHQRPHLVLGHGSVGFHGLVDGGLQVRAGLPYVVVGQAEASAAHFFQKVPDLRLEYHHHGQEAQLHRFGQDIGQDVQVEHVGDPQQKDHQANATQHLTGAGFFGEQNDSIKEIGNNGDVDQVGYLDGVQIIQHLLHGRQECVHVISLPLQSQWVNNIIILYPGRNGNNLRVSFTGKTGAPAPSAPLPAGC